VQEGRLATGYAMHRITNGLPHRYLEALRKHLALGPQANARAAWRLGRQALSAGMGTLDLAKVHEQALVALLASKNPPASGNASETRATMFFFEVLAPIERMRHSAIEGSGRLNRGNEALGRCTAELAATRRQLRQEIIKRQVVEKALKRSERHYNHLLEQAQHVMEQSRRVSHQILTAHEEERKKISRELHDEIGQGLTGINLTLATLTKAATVSVRGLKLKIARTQRLVELSMNAVHRFARQLRPAVLDDLGLIPALRAHMEEHVGRTRMRIRFTAVAAVERLDSEKRTVLYRVAQEALSNVARHAHATLVEVTITRRPDGAICLEIHDNGKSFQVQRVLRAQGTSRLGLLGMRERVEMVGGKFAVESAPGSGTTIRAQLPFSMTGVS
jgi:signal transduction histidine kinase